MKKVDSDDLYYESDDVDSELADWVRSLTFRNNPEHRRFRFIDEERPARTKRNRRQHRPDEFEIYQ